MSVRHDGNDQPPLDKVRIGWELVAVFTKPADDRGAIDTSTDWPT